MKALGGNILSMKTGYMNGTKEGGSPMHPRLDEEVVRHYIDAKASVFLDSYKYLALTGLTTTNHKPNKTAPNSLAHHIAEEEASSTWATSGITMSNDSEYTALAIKKAKQ
eukprot:10227723-Ditylum_brightwellii.AAC.1